VENFNYLIINIALKKLVTASTKVEAVRIKKHLATDFLVRFLALEKKINLIAEKKIFNKTGNPLTMSKKRRELSSFGIKLNVTTIN